MKFAFHSVSYAGEWLGETRLSLDEFIGKARALGTKVIATGGLAALIAEECPEISAVNPWLTLKGLRLLWEKNRV